MERPGIHSSGRVVDAHLQMHLQDQLLPELGQFRGLQTLRIQPENGHFCSLRCRDWIQQSVVAAQWLLLKPKG